jgi:hypothetical protein
VRHPYHWQRPEDSLPRWLRRTRCDSESASLQFVGRHSIVLVAIRRPRAPRTRDSSAASPDGLSPGRRCACGSPR